VHADLPTHQFHQPLRDRQTEAGSAELPLDCSIDLREALEKSVAFLLRNADASVLDRKSDLIFLVRSVLYRPIASYPQRYGASRSELDGVVEQVQQNLSQTVLIADQPLWYRRVDFSIESEALSVRKGPDDGCCVVDECRYREGLGSNST
jgi:hypothetical protein